MVLLGSLQGEPIKHGPPVINVDLQIYSQKGAPKKEYTNVTDVFHNIRAIVGAYVAILFQVCVTIGLSYRRKSFTAVINYYLKCIWEFLKVMFLQESEHGVTWSVKLLWLHLSLFSFIWLYGHILNLMSTDAIAIIPLRRMESMSDIFDVHFADVKMHLLKNMYFYDYLKDAPKGSKHKELFSHLAKANTNCTSISSCSFIDPNILDFHSYVKLIKRMANGASALLIPRQVIEDAFEYMMCSFDSDIMNKIRTSTDTMATGVLTYVYRKHLDKKLEDYLVYRLRTAGEFMYNESLLKRYMTLGQDNPDTAFYQCLDGYDSDKDKETIIGAPLSSFTVTAILFVGLILFALCIMLIELVFRVRKLRRRKRKRRPSQYHARWPTCHY
ncbi:hypothetical protein HDE_08160 [Halotydeus destructor]|nr:hypothetical protein HDE_08160 [Halotydeus destructor]